MSIFAFRQSKGLGNNANPVTGAFNSPVNSANLLVGFVYQRAVAAISFTDDRGNIWSPIGTRQDYAGRSAQMFYVRHSAPGTTTVTVSSSGLMDVAIHEYSLTTSAALDISSYLGVTSISPSTPLLSPSNADALIVAMCVSTDTVLSHQDPPWNSREGPSFDGNQSADRIVTSIANYQDTFNLNASGDAITGIASFTPSTSTNLAPRHGGRSRS